MNQLLQNIYQTEFGQSFSAADIAIISAVDKPQKVPESELLDTRLLARQIEENGGKRALALSGPEEILEFLRGELHAGDVIVLMSNGGFGGIHQKLLTALAVDENEAGGVAP